MLRILYSLFIGLFSFQAQAASLYDVKVNGKHIYNLFIKEGVPAAAIQRTFEFLDMNAGKAIRTKFKVRTETKSEMEFREVTVQQDFAAIIDFSKPSTERRLYILNLKNGTVAKHYVAHGKGSGVRFAAKFSNIDNTKMSSLGLFITGGTYYGKHGESLNLSGLEASNDLAAERDIVIHGADYVSEDFIKSHGRLGLSWGCPAVSPDINQKMINFFKEGRLIYAYHKELMSIAQKNPNLQQGKSQVDDDQIDLPGEEETISNNKK